MKRVKNSVDVVVIPKYGKVVATATELGTLLDFYPAKLVEETAHIRPLNFSMPLNMLDHLPRTLSGMVDLIAIDSLESTVLNNEYPSVSSIDLSANGITPFVIYSPNPTIHRGKMSDQSKSDAHYPWLIYREEHPHINGLPVAMLLQFLNPDGHTSHHFHRKTEEFFAPLFGYTNISHQQKRQYELKRPPSKNHLKQLTQIIPKIVHQLTTDDKPGVNIICMRPYDPELKDHFHL